MAEALGWSTRRRKRAALVDVEAAAKELRSHILQLPPRSRGRLPTRQELIKAGRHDLRYALQVRQCTWCIILADGSIKGVIHGLCNSIVCASICLGTAGAYY